MKILIIILGISASSLGFFYKSTSKKEEPPLLGLEVTSDETVNKDLNKVLSKTKNTAIVTAQEAWKVLKQKIIEDITKYINTIGSLFEYGKRVAADTHNKWHNISLHECDETHCYMCVLSQPNSNESKVCIRWSTFEDNKNVRLYHLCVNKKCALINNFFSVRNAMCIIYPTAPVLWGCLRIKEMNLVKSTFKLCYYAELDVLRWPIVTSRSYCIKLKENDVPYIERWDPNEKIKFFNFR